MRGISRVGHTIKWPGSGARQEHDGGEHSARGEVHREDFVYGGGCCVACLCLCVYVCWWEKRRKTRGLYTRETPAPVSRSILGCTHRMLDLAKFFEIALARDASVCFRLRGTKPLLVG